MASFIVFSRNVQIVNLPVSIGVQSSGYAPGATPSHDGA